MSGQAWYRHSPRDFLDGVVGMPPEEIGAYIVCLDLIYARGGPIPFDARWLSGCMGCSTRQATALVNRLLERGKLAFDGSHLSNERARNEIENQAERARNAAESGAKGGRTQGENRANAIKKATKTTADDKAGLSIKEENREDKKEIASAISSARDDAQSVADEWNAMAKRVGLPCVMAVNKMRRAQIAARVAEHGRDKITEAINRVEASPFCRGEVNGFRATFDFLLQSSSFIKLIEGNYDGQRLAASTNRNAQPLRGSRTMELIRSVERELAAEGRDDGGYGGMAGALALPRFSG